LKTRSHKRQPHVDENFWKSPSSTALESWFVSYSLLVPGAERFIVRSCRPYLEDRNLPEILRRDLHLCFFQEQQHALGGDAFQRSAEKQLVGFSRFRRVSEILNYRLLDKIFPMNFKVAIASAMEQMNSAIASYGLANLTKVSTNQPFRQNSQWHFIEEIEHREVIYNLQTHLKIGWIQRLFAGVLVFQSFCFWITLGSWIVAANRQNTGLNAFSSIMAATKSSGALLATMAFALLRYLKPDFHPGLEAIPHDWEALTGELDTPQPM
jgi:predicted metal-dependent hydrolase